MKKLLSIFIVLALSGAAKAQTPYKTLDSLANIINRLQSKTDDKPYEDHGDRPGCMTYLKGNKFDITSYNRMAHKIYQMYHPDDQTFKIVFYPEIDLSDVVSVFYYDKKQRTHGFTLAFAHSLKETKKFGAFTSQIMSVKYVTFFCRAEDATEMGHTLITLIDLFKIEKTN